MEENKELSREDLERMLAEKQTNQPIQIVEAQEPTRNLEDLPVTSLEDLKDYAKGTKVRFPDFAEGQPFVARVGRPSLLVLSKKGVIPNSLLASATSMFTGESGGDQSSDSQVEALTQMYDVARIVAEAALIEPTMKDFEDAGMDLSDTQLMGIFNYAQQGAKALESFR